MKKELTATQKKIKKVVEEIVVSYSAEFADKFSEEEINYAIKHKAQISKISVEDDELLEMIKSEVEDCLGAYLVKKNLKIKPVEE